MRVAAVVLGSVAVLAACGPQEGAPMPTNERAGALHARWAGTPAQQQAAEVLVAYEQNGRFTECLVARGFRHRVWQDSIRLVPPADPLAGSLWGAGRGALDFTAKKISSAWSTRFEHWANHPVSAPGETRAETECRVGDPGIDDEQISSIVGPGAYAELAERWATMMETVRSSMPPIGTYLRCLRDSEVGPRGGMPSLRAMVELLDEPLDPNAVPLGDEPDTPEWTRFVQRQAELDRADWACREEHRDEALRILAPLLDSFEIRHEAAIDHLAAHWQQVERQARDLGWTPESPTMGVALSPVPSPMP